VHRQGSAYARGRALRPPGTLARRMGKVPLTKGKVIVTWFGKWIGADEGCTGSVQAGQRQGRGHYYYPRRGVDCPTSTQHRRFRPRHAPLVPRGDPDGLLGARAGDGRPSALENGEGKFTYAADSRSTNHKEAVQRQCVGSATAVQCSAEQVQVQRQCQCQCQCQCRGSTVQCSAEAVQRQVAQAVRRQCTGAAQAVHRQCRVSPGRGRAEAGQRPTSLPYLLAIADWSAHRDGPVLGRSRSCPPVLGSDRQRETHK
jgi:hypothetical protein